VTIFVNLLAAIDKDVALANEIELIRRIGEAENRYERNARDFGLISGAPFLYFVPSALLQLVRNGKTLVNSGFRVRKGNGVSVRFHRLHWEISAAAAQCGEWPFFVHGTRHSPFYKPSYFRMKWTRGGDEAKADVLHKYPYLNGNAGFVIQGEDFYGKPGLCYGKRTDTFSAQVLPSGHQFTFEGNAIEQTDPSADPWIMLALLNSSPVAFWLSSVCAQHKYPNYVESVPIPPRRVASLGVLARRGWSLKRALDTVNETSSAFLLPEAIRARQGYFNRSEIQDELSAICVEIDEIAFEIYRISTDDLGLFEHLIDTDEDDGAEDESELDAEDADDAKESTDTSEDLISWAIGVVFGRFDWRLATGEREAPPVPDPFDPLPAKSPGMLPDGATPFHAHAGVLVDDQGCPHDLAPLVEEILARVEARVPEDVRRGLRRDFFAFHLQRYSKGRRKAPVYWPLAATSGNYTLWIYYPSLNSQTLYTAVNNFVEPKLQQVGADVTVLRSKGAARTRSDEKQFEALQSFELELIELRDTLLRIAPTYKPNQDDGVQISAAPLWPLFRHKPWQKVLKDTWVKLEKGDYDWAHLAKNYWPDRVREKCKTDKSLAIAHGLEHLYVEPEAPPKKTRGRKKAGGDE
jgi:hypothetical protein